MRLISEGSDTLDFGTQDSLPLSGTNTSHNNTGARALRIQVIANFEAFGFRKLLGNVYDANL